MPFMKIDRGVRTTHLAEPRSEVRMGMHVGNIQHPGGMIYFSFAESVINRAGIQKSEPMGKNERMVCGIDIQEGVGKDAGFLLIVSAPDGTGYTAGMSRQTARSFTMSIIHSRFKHYLIGKEQMPAHSVEFTVDEDDHSILIQCPPWLVYNPQSYVEPLKLTPPEPPKVEDRKPRQPTPRVDRIAVKAAAHALAEKAAGDLLVNRKDRRMAVSVATRMLRK